MSNINHQNQSSELLNPHNSPQGRHSRTNSAEPHPLSNSEVPSPDTTEAPNDFTRPTNRVRFRSMSNHAPVPERPPLARLGSDQSVQSYHSVGTLVAESEGTPRNRSRSRSPGPAEPFRTRDTSYRPGDDVITSSELNKQTPGRAPSGRERWKAAGQLIRQKTVRLGERLGRPHDEGEALGASLLPEDLETGTPRGYDFEAQNGPGDTDDEKQPAPSAEAHRLVRTITQGHARRRKPKSAYTRSGTTTPETPKRPGSWYHNRSLSGGGGVLGQLLKLQAAQGGEESRSGSMSVTDSSDSESGVSSGAATPKKEKLKWYKKPAHQSTASLVGASMNLSTASLPAGADAMPFTPKKGRKKASGKKTRLEDEIRVTVHIAEILARQRYIMQLCRALMRYGAPTHRLEEYMTMTARVLSVEGQFLYLPGCMIMSFDDPATRTAEVKLVRMVQGVDLGRLAETHNVYKNVVHDLIGVEEAIQELHLIMKKPPRFNKWLMVPTYGLASVAVGPFAFDARPIDMPMIFFLGSLVGFMQHILAPMSVLYSNVFEVSAAVLTSFLARALGSIRVTTDGESHRLFCFSALAQAPIALILPGFMVLCSSLELQSHQMIAGSIRMVYAIIYSLFLGYGITVGTTIYGLLDSDPTSEKTCSGMDVWGSEYIQHFIFVPVYVVFLAIVNEGRWKQVPVMMVIALSGYVTNYFSTKKLGSRSEVANTVGAFTIGILGNLYSRLWHGHAATAILPGIFVLVPSGLASSDSLMAGIDYANLVRENIKADTGSADSTAQDTSIASLGFGMIQVAIGITVGLFISALVVYPFGKRRSGLFSF